MDNFKACQSQDLEVEQQAPVVDIPKITIHSPFHLLEARCLATKNADPRPWTCPPFTAETTNRLVSRRDSNNMKSASSPKQMTDPREKEAPLFIKKAKSVSNRPTANH